MYDYNLGDELTLDENRHVDDYVVRGAVAKAVVNATSEELVPVIRAVLDGQEVFEANLDSYRLKDQWASEKEKQSQAKEWQAAWTAAAGENAVVVANKPNLGEYVSKKGFRPRTVKSDAWFGALESHGVLSDAKVLTEAEKKGSKVSEATPDMLKAVDQVLEPARILRDGERQGETASHGVHRSHGRREPTSRLLRPR